MHCHGSVRRAINDGVLVYWQNRDGRNSVASVVDHSQQRNLWRARKESQKSKKKGVGRKYAQIGSVQIVVVAHESVEIVSCSLHRKLVSSVNSLKVDGEFEENSLYYVFLQNININFWDN